MNGLDSLFLRIRNEVKHDWLYKKLHLIGTIMYGELNYENVKTAKQYSRKYKSIITFTSICVLFGMLKAKFILLIGLAGGLGAFLAGIFYASTITTPIAMYYFSVLNGNLLFLGLIIALGCTFGDYVIFRFMKDKFLNEFSMFVKDELGYDLNKLTSHIKNSRILKSSFGRKIIIPALVCLMIATPLPDEFGISLAASYKMSNRKFALISFLINFFGIIGVLGLMNLALRR
jgi:hypothetical protein